MTKKYTNRFAIDEDDQFEIHVKDYTGQDDIDEGDFYKAVQEMILKENTEEENKDAMSFGISFGFMRCVLRPNQDNTAFNPIHFIVAGDFEIEYHDDNLKKMKECIEKALRKFFRPSAILSLIHMRKLNCITKERYEKMYKTNEKTEERMDLSVGEDLETFIEKIKNGEVSKSTIPDEGDYEGTFLLNLLDKEERKKLEHKDGAFMKLFDFHKIGEVDVPEAEWKSSESNSKFARSYCSRRTYFISNEFLFSDLIAKIRAGDYEMEFHDGKIAQLSLSRFFAPNKLT